MKDNFFVFFQLKPYIIWRKRAQRSEIFRLLGGWVKIYQILCHVGWKFTKFPRLLLLKVYTMSAKKVQRSYASWHGRVMQNLKKNVSEMTRIWWISTTHLKVSKICTLICPFCAKYITFDLKKYRRVILNDTRERCKVAKKLNCDLENDMSNLASFHQSTWKCQNWEFDGILLFKAENV